MKSRSSLSHLLSILREACMQTTFFDPVDLNAIKRQSPPPHPPTAAGVPAAADTLADWLASPVSAYAAWIDPWPLKDSTKAVYRAMFGRFCQWLAVRGKRLDQLDSAREIGLFLDTPNPNLPSSRKHRSSSGRQRPQYVRLLERVFAHLESLGHRGGNPGQRAGLERIGQGADQPTRFLSWDERVAVARVLEEGLEELRQAQKGVEAWIAYRDLALVGAMAGGGLKVGHLQRLSLNCISLAERQFDLGTARRPHRARLLAFAVEPVAAWLSVRAELCGGRLDPTQPVFAVPGADGAQAHRLSGATILRRTRGVLLRAGITGERASPQTLRNAYVASLLDAALSTEALLVLLGLVSARSALRMREAYAHAKALAAPGATLEADTMEILLAHTGALP